MVELIQNEPPVEKVVCFVKPPKTMSDGWYNRGYALHVSGTALSFEKQQNGDCLEDWYFPDPSPKDYTGLLVWEGVCENLWSMKHGDDWEPRLRGVWRKATPRELFELGKGL